MGRILQCGAVLGLLSLIFVQSQAQSASPTTLPARLQARRVFTLYSTDGVSLNEEQVSDMITEELNDYIQELNIELLDELMAYADTNQDGKLDVAEYVNLVNYITKQRNK